MIYRNYLLIVDPAMHVVYFRSSRLTKEREKLKPGWVVVAPVWCPEVHTLTHFMLE